MLYKQLKDNSWLTAETEVILPDGTTINESNQKDGWKFSETPPEEYLIWLESQKIASPDIENLKEYEV